MKSYFHVSYPFSKEYSAIFGPGNRQIEKKNLVLILSFHYNLLQNTLGH